MWCLLQGGVCSWWGVSSAGGVGKGRVSAPERGAWWRPPTDTAAGGTYPTGMHSCFDTISDILRNRLLT